MFLQVAKVFSFYSRVTFHCIHIPLLYLFICWLTLYASCTWISVTFFRFETFSFIISSNTFYAPFSSPFQFSSVAQSCLTLCDTMEWSTPGLPFHHQLPEFTQTHVHWVSDAIQPSHPLLSPSPPALNPSQHQGLSQWSSSSHQVAKVLEFQLQHQPFQWTFRTDFL